MSNLCKEYTHTAHLHSLHHCKNAYSRILHIQRANYERFAYFRCIRIEQHETKSLLVFYWNNGSSYKIKLKQALSTWVYSMLESDSEFQTRTSRELNLTTKWRHRTTNRALKWFTIERVSYLRVSFIRRHDVTTDICYELWQSTPQDPQAKFLAWIVSLAHKQMTPRIGIKNTVDSRIFTIFFWKKFARSTDRPKMLRINCHCLTYERAIQPFPRYSFVETTLPSKKSATNFRKPILKAKKLKRHELVRFEHICWAYSEKHKIVKITIKYNHWVFKN